MRNLGYDIEEPTDQDLWAVSSTGYAEGVTQLLATLNVDHAAIDCEHAAAEPLLIGL